MIEAAKSKIHQVRGNSEALNVLWLRCSCSSVCARMWPRFTFAWPSTKCEPTFRWNRPKPAKGKSSLWWTPPATWVCSFFLFHTVTLSNLQGVYFRIRELSSSLLLRFRFSCPLFFFKPFFFFSISPPHRSSWRVTLSTWEETIGKPWSCWTVPTLLTTLDPSRQVTTVVSSSK